MRILGITPACGFSQWSDRIASSTGPRLAPPGTGPDVGLLVMLLRRAGAALIFGQCIGNDRIARLRSGRPVPASDDDQELSAALLGPIGHGRRLTTGR